LSAGELAPSFCSSRCRPEIQTGSTGLPTIKEEQILKRDARSDGVGPWVIVFGGTGFLGQRVVQRLLDLSVRVAVRHPERIAALFPGLHLDAIQADVNDDRSVAAAVAGVAGVVNAVSLYAESGSQAYHSVHVEAAIRVARLAREAGVGRFIHVSGIGADAECASPYIRSSLLGPTRGLAVTVAR
jgi:nucleoside-diphosphate-sugar epimerase